MRYVSTRDRNKNGVSSAYAIKTGLASVVATVRLELTYNGKNDIHNTDGLPLPYIAIY